MESIIYNISNAYFPVTVYLKEGYVPGGAVIATNTHNFAGEYSFDNVLEGQYTILVVDTFGCTKMINTPPIEEDCELDGFIECGLTTTTLEVTTTLAVTTTIEAATTLVESCVEYGVLYNWYAAIDERNITSSDDWVVPSRTQIQDLLVYCGGVIQEEGNIGTPNEIYLYLQEEGNTHWDDEIAIGENQYLFSAVGSGGRTFDGYFNDANYALKNVM